MSNEEKGLVSEKVAIKLLELLEYEVKTVCDMVSVEIIPDNYYIEVERFLKDEYSKLYEYFLEAENRDTSQDDFKTTKKDLNKLLEAIKEAEIHSKDKFMIVNELERIIEQCI